MSLGKIASRGMTCSLSAFGKTSKWHAGLLGAALISSVLFVHVAHAGEVTGSLSTSPSSPGGSVQVTFSCSGNPCNGSYRAAVRDSGCSNSFFLADTFSASGFDLSLTGPIQGSIKLASLKFSDTFNADGTCSIKPGSYRDMILPYSGN